MAPTKSTADPFGHAATQAPQPMHSAASMASSASSFGTRIPLDSGALPVRIEVPRTGRSLTWTRYCNNPVFVPTGEATWEGDATKSPEVIYDEGLYHLFFSAGAQENWRVGHAVSADGLRWARTGDGPVLPVGDPGTWEEQGTINAASLVEYGEIRLWYTGISVGPSANGVATIVDWE